MSSCGISIHDVGVLRTAFSRVMRRLLSRNLKSALCFLLVGSWRQCFNPSEYYKKHSATVKEHRFMVTTLRRSPVSWTITKAFPWTEDEIKSNQSWQQCLFSLALMVWFILNLLQINYGLTKRITNGFERYKWDITFCRSRYKKYDGHDPFMPRQYIPAIIYIVRAVLSHQFLRKR